MKRSTLILLQRQQSPSARQLRSALASKPGGHLSGRGSGSGSDMSGSHAGGAAAHATNVSHGSPSDV